jgi:hypothetical protein
MKRSWRAVAVLVGFSALLTVALSLWANVLIVGALDASRFASDYRPRPSGATGAFFVTASGPLPEVTVLGAPLLVLAIGSAAVLLARRGRWTIAALLCYAVALAQILFALHLLDVQSTTVWLFTDQGAWVPDRILAFNRAHADLAHVVMSFVVPVALAIAAAAIAGWATGSSQREAAPSSR